jgi:WD40 repeat protein/tRNA A-37 threonylcarbamoyl transferase component Bud32
MGPATGHPSEAELLAFNRGELDGAALNTIAAHLEECPGCCNHLQQLAERDRARLWLRDIPFRAADTLPIRNHKAPKINDPAETQLWVSGPATPDELRAQEDEDNTAILALQREQAAAGLPTRLGNYEILGEIARGGMGIVYKARHQKLNRIVALKVTRGGHLATAKETQRFLQEAAAVAKLDHRHIVPIYEFGEANGQHFIVMAYVEGDSLAKAVTAGPLAPRRAADLVKKVADAVAYAHAQGVIHRDLKPSNVLLDSAGEPRVTDFGLAKCEETASVLTHTGQVLGTPSFMPPEQAEGKVAQVGPAADVYSLGATLYCLLTGRPPFQAASTLDTLKQVVEQPSVPPQQINSAVDRDLDTICLKCLEKRPEKRYASATALAEDLVRFLDGRPILARRVGGPERFWRWCRRNPTVAGLAAAVLLSMLAGVAGIAWQWRIAVDNEHKAQELAGVERWERYRSNMAEASIALQQQEVELARRAVLGAPEEYRGWEWRYFARQLDLSQTSWQIRSAFCGYPLFAIHPTRWQIAVPWPDGSVNWWDPIRNPPQGAPRHSSTAFLSTIYSPDGKLLATSAEDCSIHLWKTETAQPIRVLRGHKGEIRQLVMSRDGARLASRGLGDLVRVWNTATGECLLAEPGLEVAMTPDGKGLAIARNRKLRYIPQVGTSNTHFDFLTHTAPISGLVISPDGTQLASAGVYPENKIRLWNLTTGKESAVLTGHSNYITQMAYSRDGRRLASASIDRTVCLWDPKSGKRMHQLTGHASGVTAVGFNSEATRLVSASYDGTVRLWDTATGALLAVLRGHRAAVLAVGFSHDGSHIVSSDSEGNLRLWDAQIGEASVFRGHTSFVYDVAFSPDGKLVASTAWDGTARLWDVATGRSLRQLKHEWEIVAAVSFAADGRRLLTVSRFLNQGEPRDGRKVILWDVPTGQRLRTIELSDHSFREMRAVFHPSRDRIAVGCLKDTVRFFDPGSGSEVASMRGQKSASEWAPIRDVAFRPDGAQLATGDMDRNVRLWDPVERTETAILRGHTKGVNRVTYSRDGKLLASASDDRTVRLWDTSTRQCLATLPHGDVVYGLAFSPDGTRLATGCADKTIRLWSLDTFQEVGVLRGHTSYVHAVAFSPDGRRLVSGSGDSTVRLWDSGPVSATNP